MKRVGSYQHVKSMNLKEKLFLSVKCKSIFIIYTENAKLFEMKSMLKTNQNNVIANLSVLKFFCNTICLTLTFLQ